MPTTKSKRSGAESGGVTRKSAGASPSKRARTSADHKRNDGESGAGESDGSVKDADAAGAGVVGASATDDVGDFRIEPAVRPPVARRPIPPNHAGARAMSAEDMIGYDSHLAYVARWERMRREEEAGAVQFRAVCNDGTRESLVLLLGLKNVFVKQLPNMPRPYVSRLVFDRQHESMVMIKRMPGSGDGGGEEVVMGGCCHRPFIEQQFTEIAFLAISHNEQVRGYGTRLMAHTKERAKTLGLTHLLTCADNNAVSYFKKQGFSKVITLPSAQWQGYIKDYEGVTLMECALNFCVDYLNIPPLLKAQKMCLLERLKEVSRSHIVYPGLDMRKRRGAVRVEDIPGLEHIDLDRVPPPTAAHGTRGGTAGQNAAAASAATAIAMERDPVQLAALHKELQQVLNQIKAHGSAWPFLEPVNVEETGAYNYYEVIKDPIDLSTIQRRLDEGWFYVNKDIFLADLNRMVQNAIEYNGKEHYVSELALGLQRFYSSKL